MKCPKCSSDEIKVNEKRNLEGESAIRRRRECNSCGYRFTTYERIEIPSLVVVKKNGEKETYSREKLSIGIKKAFEKRPFTPDQIESLIDEIERKINLCGCTEIESTEIGNIVVEKLKEADHVAYMRFASVYKSFQDINSFREELEKLSIK